VAGEFVGSALIFRGMPAEVDAVAVEPGRAMRWEPETLQRYLAANPDTRTLILQDVARDLAGKMEHVTAPLSKPPECSPHRLNGLLTSSLLCCFLLALLRKIVYAGKCHPSSLLLTVRVF
jgi:CRP-like cAMP-binding protein